MSFLTARFCKEHPAADVEIQSLNSRTIQRGLDAFELDGGITYLENEPLENVRRIPLYREHYVFVTRREHPLAGRRTVTWTEGRRGEALPLERGHAETGASSRTFSLPSASQYPHPIVSNSFLGIYSHLQHGEWSSIVPHTFSYMFGGMRDLVAVDLVEPVHTQSIGLVLSNREPPSPMSNALLASVLEGDLGFTFSQPRGDLIGIAYQVFQTFHWIPADGWGHYPFVLIGGEGAASARSQTRKRSSARHFDDNSHDRRGRSSPEKFEA